MIAPSKLRFIALMAAMLIGLAMPVSAQQLAKDVFGSRPGPTAGKPQAIGTYNRGCATGLVQLPETGPTWQAMRLSRNRNWGHPQTVDFLKGLSRAATKAGWRGLYIGDISQPRGGPMLSGHQSHQLGLDADIWMLPPPRLNLSRAERENISSISVRSKDQRRVNGNFTASHMAVIRAAAKDRRVARIFVTAPAKIAMCQMEKGDRRWLRKVRPWWGHHYHFHVRLNCPAGSPGCQGQDAPPPGDGCDASLNWWVTEALNPTKPAAPAKPGPVKRSARTFRMTDLPRACQAVAGTR